MGATVAAINAIKFCRKKNPFNGSIIRFATETMVGQYFTYIECLGKKPIFAEQNIFNAKKFYNECYKEIENQIDDEVLKNMYTMQLAGKAQDLIGIIPKITFFDFMDKIKNEEYNGIDEFNNIRKSFPKEILDNEIVIAHNAGFDLAVLKSLLDKYNLNYPNLLIGDTLRVAKIAFKDELPNCKLNTISSYLEICHDHHNAQSDANVCFYLIERCKKIYGAIDISELFEMLNQAFGANILINKKALIKMKINNNKL